MRKHEGGVSQEKLHIACTEAWQAPPLAFMSACCWLADAHRCRSWRASRALSPRAARRWRRRPTRQRRASVPHTPRGCRACTTMPPPPPQPMPPRLGRRPHQQQTPRRSCHCCGQHAMRSVGYQWPMGRHRRMPHVCRSPHPCLILVAWMQLPSSLHECNTEPSVP